MLVRSLPVKNFNTIGVVVQWDYLLSIILPTAPRVSGLNPGRSKFIFATLRRFNYKTGRKDDKMERSTARRPREEEKGGSGEERLNDRQANEEWLRERIQFELAIRLNG